MDKPVRQYQKQKDYQRHKLFRKMKRRRKAEAELESLQAIKMLKRKLKVPRFEDGKVGYHRVETGNPVAFDDEGLIYDLVTGDRGRITLPEVVVQPAMKTYRDLSDLESRADFIASNDVIQDPFGIRSSNEHLNLRARRGERSAALWAQEHPNLYDASLVAGATPFAVASAPAIVPATDAVAASSIGSAITAGLTNPYVDAALLSAGYADALNSAMRGEFGYMNALEMLPLPGTLSKVYANSTKMLSDLKTPAIELANAVKTPRITAENAASITPEVTHFYHGSPVRFDAFSADFIGSGEGGSKVMRGINLWPTEKIANAPKFANIKSPDAPLHLGVSSTPLGGELNPTVYDVSGRGLKLYTASPREVKGLSQSDLISQGYDGIQTPNQVTVFPESIGKLSIDKQSTIDEFVRAHPEVERWTPWTTDNQKMQNIIDMSKMSKWTPEQWTAAQDAAIARGDVVEAQRLRDLHFKVNAPDTKVDVPLWTSSEETFNSFDLRHFGKTDSGFFGYGHYMTPIEDYAASYHPINRKFYVNIQNPYIGDNDAHFNRINYVKDRLARRKEGVLRQLNKGRVQGFGKRLGITENTSLEDAERILDRYIADETPIWNNKYVKYIDEFKGKDGVLSWRDIQGVPNKREGIYKEVVVPRGEQIKSADAVTYDDNSVRVPLGERDNFNINDIRYGLIPFGIGIGAVIDALKLKTFNTRIK